MGATSAVWAHVPCVTRSPHSHRATVPSPRASGRLCIGHVRRAVGQRGGLVLKQANSARCHDITVERLELADCWGAADCHAEVFTPATDAAARAFWRAARVLRWSDMTKRQQARKLTEFQPTCAERFSTLAAVGEELPSCTPPTALLSEALQVVTKEMLQRDGTPVAGLICVETMTEFLPERRGGAGMPDPQWAPRRFRRREIAYISDLAVRPAMRGAGVGGRLLEAAEEEAKSWGCRAAMLHVNVSNAAALALYRHRGYRAVCIEKNPRCVIFSREEFLMYKRFVQDAERRD